MKVRFSPDGCVATLACLAVLGIAGCDRAPGPSAGAEASATLGGEIDDSILSARVAAALVSDLAARSYGFQIETRKGDVQISGFAQQQADIERALELARAVPGVKSVGNKASVKAADSSVGARVDDGIITARVKTALIADANVRGLNIGVATDKGEVKLAGFIDAPSQGERAVEIARTTEGVRAVDNQMQVRQ